MENALAGKEEKKKERQYGPLPTPSLASAHSGRLAPAPPQDWQVCKERSCGRADLSWFQHPRDPLGPRKIHSVGHPGQGTPGRTRSEDLGRFAFLPRKSQSRGIRVQLSALCVSIHITFPSKGPHFEHGVWKDGAGTESTSEENEKASVPRGPGSWGTWHHPPQPHQSFWGSL